MIVGSSLTIEIGDRTLLRDASFVVGAGEKVGLVGRNGTGKSTFISVVIDEPGRNVRSTGTTRIRGTFAYLPQVPVPQGLGLEPNGFSHVLSARGLDVLDDALNKARDQMAKDPSAENIELFSDLEEQFRENGGYEAESIMSRLADGLGLRQDLLLEDIEDLSGGQRRRVDLIRILFQEPDEDVYRGNAMGLDYFSWKRNTPSQSAPGGLARESRQRSARTRAAPSAWPSRSLRAASQRWLR